jgi:uncharacterized RDD family membrane protein YckC
MSTISITTTQNIELEYELASVGERVVARLIDLLIIGGYLFLFMVIIGFSSFGSFLENNAYLVIILFIIPAFFYHLVFEMTMNGQSPGKRTMNIKVISLNGQQPRFSQYLMRWLFRLIDMDIGNGLIALIVVAATKNHQRIGDLVAGTTVVNTRPRNNLQQTLYVPTIDTNYIVTYPQVIKLKDSDMQLIKEVLVLVRQSGNSYFAFEAARKIEDVLHIKMQSEGTLFLQTLLADYNHLTAKA